MCEGAMGERQKLRVTQGHCLGLWGRRAHAQPAAHASFRDVTHQFHLITNDNINIKYEDLYTGCIERLEPERAAYAEIASRTGEKRAAMPL